MAGSAADQNAEAPLASRHHIVEAPSICLHRHVAGRSAARGGIVARGGNVARGEIVARGGNVARGLPRRLLQPHGELRPRSTPTNSCPHDYASRISDPTTVKGRPDDADVARRDEGVVEKHGREGDMDTANDDDDHAGHPVGWTRS